MLFRSRTASFREKKKDWSTVIDLQPLRPDFWLYSSVFNPLKRTKAERKDFSEKKKKIVFEIKSLPRSGAQRTRTCGLDMWRAVAFHICTLTTPYKKYRKLLVSLWNQRSYHHTPFIPRSASCAQVSAFSCFTSICSTFLMSSGVQH